MGFLNSNPSVGMMRFRVGIMCFYFEIQPMLRTRYLQFCLKDISSGLLGLRFTDLAEVVTSVPPWVVWLDYTGLVVGGTEPHRSKAVYRRGKNPVMIDCYCLMQIHRRRWCHSTHASVALNTSPLRFHALTMVTSSVPFQACRGQQLEAR